MIQNSRSRFTGRTAGPRARSTGRAIRAGITLSSVCTLLGCAWFVCALFVTQSFVSPSPISAADTSATDDGRARQELTAQQSGSAQSGSAQSGSADAAQHKASEKDWQILFDGKSLDGWKRRNGTATYHIEDGAIVGTTEPGSPNSFLCTERDYGDFELRFEVMLDDGRLNSGVQIRSRTKDTPTGRVNGPQVEIEASGERGAEAGYVYGEACGGWMTPREQLVPHKNFIDSAWNTYRIVAVGPRIRVWVNGKQISDLTSPEKFASHPRGFIGLQVHSIPRDAGPYSVRWRNIKIRDLEDAPR